MLLAEGISKRMQLAQLTTSTTGSRRAKPRTPPLWKATRAPIEQIPCIQMLMSKLSATAAAPAIAPVGAASSRVAVARMLAKQAAVVTTAPNLLAVATIIGSPPAVAIQIPARLILVR